MVSTPNDVHGALTAGVAYPTGEFRYEVPTDTWWWSDEVFRMHGFEPGEVVPTTPMILAHKHPEDRARVAGALENGRLHAGFFGSVHRIRDASGAERVLAIIGESRLSDAGVVTEISGHFVDVTGSVRTLASNEATRQIQAADEHRSLIDQAVGVLVHHSGQSPEEAFDTLREASMRSNVKLRVLAARVVDAALAGLDEPLDLLAGLAADRVPPSEPEQVSRPR
ncbi:MAG: PAS and ANTAR domain-containing protein [Promicromonosporaceae bacterium]|nr:PAS and ANTAR domain-containing protein [Promicromonosporaceae bacterium]